MSTQQTNRRAEPGRSNPTTVLYTWLFGILIGATLSAWIGLAMASTLGGINPNLPHDPCKIATGMDQIGRIADQLKIICALWQVGGRWVQQIAPIGAGGET